MRKCKKSKAYRKRRRGFCKVAKRKMLGEIKCCKWKLIPKDFGLPKCREDDDSSDQSSDNSDDSTSEDDQSEDSGSISSA